MTPDFKAILADILRSSTDWTAEEIALAERTATNLAMLGMRKLSGESSPALDEELRLARAAAMNIAATRAVKGGYAINAALIRVFSGALRAVLPVPNGTGPAT